MFEDTPKTGCFNKMIALGVNDPDDERKYKFIQRRTWFAQIWFGGSSLLCYQLLRLGGMMSKIPKSNTMRMIAFAVPALIIGVRHTFYSTHFYNVMDDKYYPLYIQHLRNKAKDDES